MKQKIANISENLDEEIEKFEDRLGVISNSVQETITLKKMSEILKDLVSCEEITEIAKEIDRKISN